MSDEKFLEEVEETYLLYVPSNLIKQVGKMRQSLRFANQKRIKAQQQESQNLIYKRRGVQDSKDNPALSKKIPKNK